MDSISPESTHPRYFCMYVLRGRRTDDSFGLQLLSDFVKFFPVVSEIMCWLRLELDDLKIQP